MSQQYNDPRRADDPYSLPDLEVFYAEAGEWATGDEEEEVTFANANEPGWYWWPCFPGCLPDSEANGPFQTEAEALADAREGLEDGV